MWGVFSGLLSQYSVCLLSLSPFKYIFSLYLRVRSNVFFLKLINCFLLIQFWSAKAEESAKHILSNEGV